MKYARLTSVLWVSLLFAGSPHSESNVNSRYIVESVAISGHENEKLSSSLRSEMKRLVGERVDPALIDNLARRIRKELHVTSVSHRLLKGDEPEHVKVVFDVKGHRQDFDATIPKFTFHSKQGWSGAAE